jgi:hypothetical protein
MSTKGKAAIPIYPSGDIRALLKPFDNFSKNDSGGGVQVASV